MPEVQPVRGAASLLLPPPTADLRQCAEQNQAAEAR